MQKLSPRNSASSSSIPFLHLLFNDLVNTGRGCLWQIYDRFALSATAGFMASWIRRRRLRLAAQSSTTLPLGSASGEPYMVLLALKSPSLRRGSKSRDSRCFLSSFRSFSKVVSGQLGGAYIPATIFLPHDAMTNSLLCVIALITRQLLA